MDQEKFDALVQKLTADASRRNVVRGAVGGAVGSALAAVGLQSASAAKKKGKKGKKGKDDVGAEACLPAGTRCRNGGKPKSKKSPRRCSRCCTGESSKATGKKRCCQDDGTTCSADRQCCTGICVGNVCGPVS